MEAQLTTAQGKRASLFVTCLVDQLFPEVGVSTVRLLRDLGVEVDFPPSQTCCGQPLYNAGFAGRARDLASRMLDAFQPREESDSQHYVVVPSGSCTSMIRVFYPHLFRGQTALHRRALALGGRVYELSQFLVDVLKVSDVGSPFQGKVAYHPSCHLLRELEVVEQPRALIDSVTGARPVEIARSETCCGFGGTFSVKYPHISGAMLDDKVEDVLNSGADALVACDMSCLMHIGGGLSRRGSAVRPMHLAQLLCPGN
jgi:L-lactate dehydrogenase complex protein LldE